MKVRKEAAAALAAPLELFPHFPSRSGEQTTVYVGPHYEKNVTTGQETRYYFFGPDRVAMRKAGVVYWLLTDHLGSTSLTLDSSGTKVGELRYKAYGDIRYTWGTTPTDHRFTDQLLDRGIGLYHMGARWYDPELGRWTSPDTVVPTAAGSSGGAAATMGYDDHVRLTPLTVAFYETRFLSMVVEENQEIATKGFWFELSESEQNRSKYQWGPVNPQALNRYAYCLGNPVKYVDPTGHYQWLVVSRQTWGPLSRREADQANSSYDNVIDVLTAANLALAPYLGIPARGVAILGWASVLLSVDSAFHKGDWGTDTIYHDTEKGEYWRLVYSFDEDDNILSFEEYFSWDGSNWTLTDSSYGYPEDEEQQNQ